ncbi:uncharacterized protein LOC133730492 [Rosa rugosa]|uniref:uncharacterized protein LOC133730492 n=1 Tax=Rosa rugosa TaxID=74645 RepID=UPI002B40AFF9|nr:uncharacterized protein LOC133730492 [Rosa rugosa]
MNTFQISSSSLSSNGTNDYYYRVLASFDEEQDLLIRMYANNNHLLAELDDNEDDEAESRRRGAVLGHIVINRPRQEAGYNLYMDYFVEVLRFGEAKFRRQFRMSKSLFHQIAEAVKDHDNFFVQHRDGIGKLRLSSLQKFTAVFRMLAYGVPADALDEYLKIGESTAIRCMKRFCQAVIEVFGNRYLRTPNAEDVVRLLYIGEERGFPAEGKSPPVNYKILEKDYDIGYYLADGIYPKWSTLVQTIHDPQGPKKVLFGKKQESCRKDVERAFGVLQSHWAIIKGPARFWNKCVLHDIMTTCIIMHNMIIEDERDLSAPINDFNPAPALSVELVTNETTQFEEFLARHRKIKDKSAHIVLRNALIHI